jgi:ribonuclease VapC
MGAAEVIVDSSAVLAILLNEGDADYCRARFLDYPMARMSAANYLEIAIRIERDADKVAAEMLDDFIAKMNITILPVTVEQARIARQAFATYGKGMGHPAQLNFGDCFTYALARVTGEPLLHKGNDFNQTDLSIL